MGSDAHGAAIVVVDMQNAFCHPDGNLFAEPSAAAIDPVTTAVERGRDSNVPIVFTRDAHPPGQFDGNHYYDEFDRWGEHAVEGSWDAEIVDGIEVEEDDRIVEKHTYDAFYRTDLAGHLDAHGIRDIVICGTLANVCVLHTAGSAGLRDYRPIVVEDALGYITESHKAYAVDHADWLFGETTMLADVAFD